MKKVLLTLLSVTLLFCSCGSTDMAGVEAEEAVPEITESIETDYLSGYTGSSSTVDSITEGEDGNYYYCFSRSVMSALVGFDSATGTAEYLCDDESCEHNSTSCSAYTRKVVSALTCSDNELYWVESEISEVKNEDGAFKYKYDYTVCCRDIESGTKVELSIISNLDYSYVVGFYKGTVIMISDGTVYKADIKSGEMSKVCDITFLEDSDYKLYAETNAGKLNIILVYYVTDYEAEEVTYTIQKSTIDLDSGEAEEQILQNPVISSFDFDEITSVPYIMHEVYFSEDSFIFAVVCEDDILYCSCRYDEWELTELGSVVGATLGAYYDFSDNAIYFVSGSVLTGISILSGEELLKIEIPDYEELSDADSILVEMHRDGNFLITATRSNTDSVTQQGWLLTASEETNESTLHSCNAVSLWVK
ncbi:MAG: hypothetical protein LUH23_00875 [Oscillospiraceae bacterium]|nr:hypothetical protein [Oscillospiraceae bacterium]